MRATDRLALALALGAALAPRAARAQEPRPAETRTETTSPPAAARPAPPPSPSAPRLRLPLGAPPDPAAFPAVPPATAAEPAGPGVELHGFAAGWWTPWSEASPTAAKDVFRLRFAVLRVDAQLGRNVTVLGRLGLMVPDSPLLDFHVTWTPHAAFGVTVGQFRLPIGAAATTLAPQLVMLDRPGYVYAMTKATFRDVGVMFHSSPRGIADGLVHYWLAAAGGGGRLGVGPSRAPGPVDEYLYAARVLVNPGRRFLRGPQDRLALGLSWARSVDPAIAAGGSSANVLGRALTQTAAARETQLLGADLTFAHAGVWAQAEVLYLRSRALGTEATREALGASVELAYTLPVRPWDLANLQLAARGERFDPNLDVANDEQLVASVGLNVIPAPAWRASIFGSVTAFHAPMTGASQTAGEVSLRLAAAF